MLRSCYDNTLFEIVYLRDVPSLDFALEELVAKDLLHIRYYINFESFEFMRIITSELNLTGLTE